MYQNVLTFWFAETDPNMWWAVDSHFDDIVRQRFLNVLESAARGELFAWRTEPKGRLAEVIVLDQFSRNIYRNTPNAFAQDAMALVLAEEAIALGVDALLSTTEKGFLYLPFMHSESKRIHEWAEKLYSSNGLHDQYEFELKHKAIIDRFGRYPHRNEILGRTSSTEEIEFLTHAESHF